MRVEVADGLCKADEPCTSSTLMHSNRQDTFPPDAAEVSLRRGLNHVHEDVWPA